MGQRRSASYLILVHRLAIYAPRFLPTLGHTCAVAIHFICYDQLMAGLAPTRVRPCWAHTKKAYTLCKPLIYLVGPVGIEPTTKGL